jgi:hypothetical protein
MLWFPDRKHWPSAMSSPPTSFHVLSTLVPSPFDRSLPITGPHAACVLTRPAGGFRCARQLGRERSPELEDLRAFVMDRTAYWGDEISLRVFAESFKVPAARAGSAKPAVLRCSMLKDARGVHTGRAGSAPCWAACLGSARQDSWRNHPPPRFRAALRAM